jgi:hypothetical protein
MNDYNENYQRDEIDLRELFITLWRGKIYIILTVFSCIFLASYYLHSTERKFTVEYKLKPVGESTPTTPQGLGSLASLAGVDLSGGTSTEFKVFKELLKSVEVSETIFKNKQIINNIYGSEWNASLNAYSKPPKTKVQTYISNIRKTLTGSKDLVYMPPNARRLVEYIKKNVDIIPDLDTGFITIQSVTSKPELLSLIMVEMAEVSDDIMRQRYVDFSAEPLAFYKEKLSAARSREHRESLALLIGKEEQKLMLASRGKYFIAEPYLHTTVSLEPTSPNAKLILIVSFIIGIFISSVVLLSIFYFNMKYSDER